jgi:hypothetical protein
MYEEASELKLAEKRERSYLVQVLLFLVASLFCFFALNTDLFGAGSSKLLSGGAILSGGVGLISIPMYFFARRDLNRRRRDARLRTDLRQI